MRSYVGRMEHNNVGEPLHGEITGKIIAAMYDVHNELGYGFLESIYKNAMAVALRELGLRVDRTVVYEVHYHGVLLGRYVADLVVELKVNVETKTARSIATAHTTQTLNYLKASGLEVGLALNFGLSAQFKRIVLSQEHLAQRRRWRRGSEDSKRQHPNADCAD